MTIPATSQARAASAWPRSSWRTPRASWPQAWVQICVIACGVLDVLRKEAHARLGGTWCTGGHDNLLLTQVLQQPGSRGRADSHS